MKKENSKSKYFLLIVNFLLNYKWNHAYRLNRDLAAAGERSIAILMSFGCWPSRTKPTIIPRRLNTNPLSKGYRSSCNWLSTKYKNA